MAPGPQQTPERGALLFAVDGAEGGDAAATRSAAAGLRPRHLALAVAAVGLFGSAAVLGRAPAAWRGAGTPPATSAMRGGRSGVVNFQEVILEKPSRSKRDHKEATMGRTVRLGSDDEGTAENITRAIEAAKGPACSSQGESCLKSECCSDPGLQCFTKDAWWAQCLPSCTPGPNVVDQSSPAPWECKALGTRAPGRPQNCSADGEDCSESRCCKSGGTQCFRKDKMWAACLPQCTPGPNMRDEDPHPWSCEVLGPRTPGAASWVAQRCARDGEKCAEKGCCAEPGMQCYTQSPWYSKCRATCTPGAKDVSWDHPWQCKKVGMRTPERAEGTDERGGLVAPWVREGCSAIGENCLDTGCCHAVGHKCFKQGPYWAQCKPSCSTELDSADGNVTWDCEELGPRSWGLALKGYPSLYCISLFMPSSYEGPLLKAHLSANAGIFQCDGYDVFAADPYKLGRSKDGMDVEALLIPRIRVGVSQDGTAGNAKLFMALWDKVIARNHFRNFDFTLKADPDAVLIPWRLRDHMRPHIGSKSYVVNCNKFPNSPNFPMMFGAVEIFSLQAMDAYAAGSWKCGTQLPWKAWGEDYYMTHCLDYLGVGRIADFGVLGDNVCTGANCADPYKGSFHPFKSIDSWMQCWGQAMGR